MNTLRCPRCDLPLARVVDLKSKGWIPRLKCLNCRYIEPLPADQQLQAQGAPRLEGL